MFRQEILVSKCIYTDKSIQSYFTNGKVESNIYLYLEEFDHENNLLGLSTSLYCLRNITYWFKKYTAHKE